ncbi:hypothetical protein C2845_PM15G14270 [Panicum miliaceum]|uniref:TFIIS N-terminal domain-containing protein n=1 Tax=Panicum miliaceum TaxID=4540 RepID=A0A3L6Q4U5_PANMI|nr:hypothetical protein C2845_PM15G14270 [Panicum miliaceum]
MPGVPKTEPPHPPLSSHALGFEDSGRSCRRLELEQPAASTGPLGAAARAPRAARAALRRRRLQRPAPASPEAEADAAKVGAAEAAEELGAGSDPGLESKIVAIRVFLEDPDQPDDELETGIGQHVNGLRKHPSAKVRRLVKQLIRKWKEIVHEWVRLHNSGGDGGFSIIGASLYRVLQSLLA